MPRQIPRDAVAKSVITGIERAQNDYEDLSGGDWVWTAAEYWITTYVAKEVGGIPGSKLVTVESSAKQAVKDAGGSRRGRPPSAARLGGRFDILLWYANGFPRAVIEIKSQSPISQVLKDANRIQSLLKSRSDSSTLSFGVIGYYFSAKPSRSRSGQDKVHSQVESLVQEVRTTSDSDVRVIPYVSDIAVQKSADAWGACAILLC